MSVHEKIKTVLDDALTVSNGITWWATIKTFKVARSLQDGVTEANYKSARNLLWADVVDGGLPKLAKKLPRLHLEKLRIKSSTTGEYSDRAADKLKTALYAGALTTAGVIKKPTGRFLQSQKSYLSSRSIAHRLRGYKIEVEQSSRIGGEGATNVSGGALVRAELINNPVRREGVRHVAHAGLLVAAGHALSASRAYDNQAIAQAEAQGETYNPDSVPNLLGQTCIAAAVGVVYGASQEIVNRLETTQ